MELTISINKGKEIILLDTDNRDALKNFIQEFVQNKKLRRFEILRPKSKALNERLFKSLLCLGDEGFLFGCTVEHSYESGEGVNDSSSKLEVFKHVRKNRKKIGEGSESRNPGYSGGN